MDRGVAHGKQDGQLGQGLAPMVPGNSQRSPPRSVGRRVAAVVFEQRYFGGG